MPDEKFFKILADETRLNILFLLLKEEPLCVCSIRKVLGLSQSKASRHLRIMYNGGLLDSRRLDVWIFYNISTDLSDNEKKLLDTLRDIAKVKMKGLYKKLGEWLSSRERAKMCPMDKMHILSIKKEKLV